MALVTLLSGLAVPIGVLIGAGPMDGESRAVEIFEGAMWIVNPFGMWAFQFPFTMFPMIGIYLVGTMLSALLWGYIDAFIKRRE